MKNYTYTIYQVNSREELAEEFIFMRWEWAKKHGWSFTPYKVEWSGTEEARDDYDLLNYLFEKFNLNHPEGFMGHSMSVSDIIKLCAEDGEVKYYYCDSFGWKDITKEIKGE